MALTECLLCFPSQNVAEFFFSSDRKSAPEVLNSGLLTAKYSIVFCDSLMAPRKPYVAETGLAFALYESHSANKHLGPRVLFYQNLP